MLPYNDVDIKLVRYAENRKQTKKIIQPHTCFTTTILTKCVLFQGYHKAKRFTPHFPHTQIQEKYSRQVKSSSDKVILVSHWCGDDCYVGHIHVKLRKRCDRELGTVQLRVIGL